MSNTGVANMGATFLRAVALFTLALSFSGYRVQGCCVGLHQGHADMVQAVRGVLRAGPDVAHVTHLHSHSLGQSQRHPQEAGKGRPAVCPGRSR